MTQATEDLEQDIAQTRTRLGDTIDRLQGSLSPSDVLDDLIGRRVEDGRGSLGLVWQRSVSRPRSSNRTCGFPASGFPTGFTARHTAARRVRCVLPKQWAMADAPSSTDRRPSSPRGKASSEASGYSGGV